MRDRERLQVVDMLKNERHRHRPADTATVGAGEYAFTVFDAQACPATGAVCVAAMRNIDTRLSQRILHVSRCSVAAKYAQIRRLTAQLRGVYRHVEGVATRK